MHVCTAGLAGLFDFYVVCSSSVNAHVPEFAVVHSHSFVCDEACVSQRSVTGCLVLDEVAAGSACETSTFKSIHALLEFNGPNHNTSMQASFSLPIV